MDKEENRCEAKPFIKWVGGKGQLLSQIRDALPRDFSNWSDAVYVEPFVGGGAMLFFILRTFPNITQAYINDINPDLIACYKSVKNDPQKLIDSLSKIEKEYKALTSEATKKNFFLEQRRFYNTDRQKMSSVDVATLFFFLNRTCFNGLYRVNGKGAFNVPFGRNANPTICDEKTIWADSELLQKVEILNGDFENTFQEHKDNTLYYFDPPYRPLNATSNFKDYAKEPFNDEEQVRLKIFCDKIQRENQKFLLSNSDCMQSGDSFFDDLYGDYNIQRVSASRSINANGKGRGKINEILVNN